MKRKSGTNNYHILLWLRIYIADIFYSLAKNLSKPRQTHANMRRNVLRGTIRPSQQNESRGANTERFISLRSAKSYFIGNEQDYQFIRAVCEREGVEFTDTYFRSAWDCYGGVNLVERRT